MNNRTKAEWKAAGYSVYTMVAIVVALSIGDLWPENKLTYAAVTVGIVLGGLIMSTLLTYYFKRFPELDVPMEPEYEENERVIQVEKNALLIFLSFVFVAVLVRSISESGAACAVVLFAGVIAWASYGSIYTKKAYREANS